MGRANWKEGLTAASSLEDVVDMGGHVIPLFKFTGRRKSGKLYSVEAYAVRGAQTSYRSSGVFYGSVHRTDGRPTTRNCHEREDGDLLEAMKTAIRDAVEFCHFVDDPKFQLMNSVAEGKYEYGSPSVEALCRVRREELDATRVVTA